MRLLCLSIITVALALSARTARAECNCVAIAGDVSAAIQAEVAKADGLYARGDFSGALALYAKAYGTAKEPSLLYAQAMANWQLGASAEAKALFQQYLSASGSLAYRDRAEAGLAGINAGVSAAAAGAAGVAGGLRGAGDVGAGVAGGVAGGVGAGVDAGAGVVGGVRGGVQAKAKVGKKAGLVLGVIAVAAIGIVGIHSLRAGISDDVDFDFDPKFHLGLGVAGVAVGISAIYVAGLTAATSAACAPGLASLPAKKPIVAPYAMPGGGGLAAAMTF